MLQESVKHCIFFYCEQVKLNHSSCILTFNVANNIKNKKQWEILLTPNEKLPLLPEIVTKNRSLRCNTNNLRIADIKKLLLT